MFILGLIFLCEMNAFLGAVDAGEYLGGGGLGGGDGRVEGAEGGGFGSSEVFVGFVCFECGEGVLVGLFE